MSGNATRSDDANEAPNEEKDNHVEGKEKHQKGQKRHAEELSDVHSANDWEHAELGDANRKNKFLRLMGAGKKDHHGKIIIGDQHSAHVHRRSDEESQKLTENLEGQFKQSLEHKLSGGARRHKGLGFSEEEKKKEEENKQAEENKEDPEHQKTEESGDQTRQQEDTPSEPEAASENPKAKKLGKSMNFVKASS